MKDWWLKACVALVCAFPVFALASSFIGPNDPIGPHKYVPPEEEETGIVWSVPAPSPTPEEPGVKCTIEIEVRNGKMIEILGIGCQALGVPE